MKDLRSARLALTLLLAMLFAMPTGASAAPFFADRFDTSPTLASAQTAGAWYTDRYAPAAFESVAFGGDNRLRLGISSADSTSSRPPAYVADFYNTQGRKYDLGTAKDSYIAGSLYVGSDWETGTHRSDLWATCFGTTGEAGGPTAYPIVGFLSGTGFRVFDSTGDDAGWHSVAFPANFAYGQWHSLRIELTDAGLLHYLDGQLVYTDTDATDSTQFGNMMLQAYNFSQDYDAHWDNVSAGPIDRAAPVTTDDHHATHIACANVSLSATDTISGVASTLWRLDGGAWNYGTACTTSVLGPHTLDYRSLDFAGNTEDTVTVTFSVVPATRELTRFGGRDRYEVAVNAARDIYPGWTGVEDVIIASGEDRAAPDALSAAGLAGTLDAPLLLSRWDSIDPRLLEAIEEMPAGVNLVVVGGAGSVSDKTLDALADLPNVGSVERVDGVDRYEVAAEVARAMADVLGPDMPSSALVANGNQSNAMFDALTASAVSAQMLYPVILVRDASVPDASAQAIEELDLSELYIVGGPASVSESVRLELGVPAGNRLSGTDRYAVARTVAERALAEGWATDASPGFAAKLPDAATGGAYMGKRGGVMLYTRQATVPEPTAEFVTANKADITAGWVFGGTASVSDGVFQQLLQLMN